MPDISINLGSTDWTGYLVNCEAYHTSSLHDHKRGKSKCWRGNSWCRPDVDPFNWPKRRHVGFTRSKGWHVPSLPDSVTPNNSPSPTRSLTHHVTLPWFFIFGNFTMPIERGAPFMSSENHRPSDQSHGWGRGPDHPFFFSSSGSRAPRVRNAQWERPHGTFFPPRIFFVVR